MPFWRSDWFLAESGTQFVFFRCFWLQTFNWVERGLNWQRSTQLNVQIDTQIFQDLSSWVDPKRFWSHWLATSTPLTLIDHGGPKVWSKCLPIGQWRTIDLVSGRVILLSGGKEGAYHILTTLAARSLSWQLRKSFRSAAQMLAIFCSFDTAFSKAAVLRRTQIPSLEVLLGWWAKHNRRREYCVARTATSISSHQHCFQDAAGTVGLIKASGLLRAVLTCCSWLSLFLS